MSLKDSHLLARRQDLKEDVLCVLSVVFREIQTVCVLVCWLSSTAVRWFLLQDIAHHTEFSRGWVESNLIYTRGAQIPVVCSSTCCNRCAKYSSIIITVTFPLHTKICISLHAASIKRRVTVMYRSLQDCWTSVRNLLLVTHPASNIWRRRLYFWKICASLIRTF
jgi:hypothetical protein